MQDRLIQQAINHVLIEEYDPKFSDHSYGFRPERSAIVLDELDRELEKRGHSFVRYADDCNIYVSSKRAGERVLESTRRFVEKKLRLKVNEECRGFGHRKKVSGIQLLLKG
ncbi:MAG: reverse transcriptase domain-containing protein [Chloroflexota bacterium]